MQNLEQAILGLADVKLGTNQTRPGMRKIWNKPIRLDPTDRQTWNKPIILGLSDVKLGTSQPD